VHSSGTIALPTCGLALPYLPNNAMQRTRDKIGRSG
jgi:hypothetical protein